MNVSKYHCFSLVLDVINVGRTSAKWPYFVSSGTQNLNPIKFLKSGTLSLQLSESVPALTLFIVISRPTISSRPSNPLNAFFRGPQIRHLLITILTYLLTLVCRNSASETHASNWRVVKKLATKPRLLSSWSAMNRMRMPPSRAIIGCQSLPQNHRKGRGDTLPLRRA